MKVTKALDFIGHSSSHPELEDFLLSTGIKNRLTSKDFPSAILYCENESVALQFTSSYVENYGASKNDSFLFLEDITVLNKKFNEKSGEFTGEIPLGLSLSMKENDVLDKFDQPDRSGEFLDGFFLTYEKILKDLEVRIKLDIQTREISFVRFSPVEA